MQKCKHQMSSLLILFFIIMTVKPAIAHSPDSRSWLPLILFIDVQFLLLVFIVIFLTGYILFKEKLRPLLIIKYITIGNIFILILWYVRFLQLIGIKNDSLIDSEMLYFSSIIAFTITGGIIGLIHSVRRDKKPRSLIIVALILLSILIPALHIIITKLSILD